MGLERETVEKEFETCYACGESTNVRKDTPLDERPHYIDGIGQACVNCYKENNSPIHSKLERSLHRIHFNIQR